MSSVPFYLFIFVVRLSEVTVLIYEASNFAYPDKILTFSVFYFKYSTFKSVIFPLKFSNFFSGKTKVCTHFRGLSKWASSL